MQIAQVLAGYTLGGADLLRRAMGKKIQSEMDAQRQQFVDGAVGARRRARAGRADLRPDGQICRLRLQQTACRGLCAGHLSDRLSEGQPPGRVSRRVDDARPRQHRQAQPFPPGTGPARHPAVAARHQPLAADLFGRRPIPRAASPRSAMRWPRSKGSANRRCVELVARARPERPVQGPCSISPAGSTPRASTAASSRASPAPAPSTRSIPTGRRPWPRPTCCCATRAAPPRSAKPGRRACSRAIDPAFAPRPSLPLVDDWPAVEKLQQEFAAIGFYLSSHPLDAYGRSLERAGILRWAGSAGGAGGERRDPLPPRRHRRRPQGAHLGARQPVCLCPDVGPERHLRGHPVRRDAAQTRGHCSRRVSRLSSPSMCAARRTACG